MQIIVLLEIYKYMDRARGLMAYYGKQSVGKGCNFPLLIRLIENSTLGDIMG